MRQEIHLRPEARLEALPDLIQAAAAFAQGHELSPSRVYSLTVALEEHFANTALFGFKEESRPEVEVILRREEAHLVCEVIDNGSAFNPLAGEGSSAADSQDQSQRRKALAADLLSRTMERSTWQREEGRNRLRLEYTLG